MIDVFNYYKKVKDRKGDSVKNNKAFTLIELLAILVILAIIAVITIPIILNVIENTRKGAAIDSAYGYKDSVSKYFLSELVKDDALILDGSYTVSDGVLSGSFGEGKTTTLEIPVAGEKPTGGYLSYSNNKMNGGCLIFDEYAVTFGSDGTVTDTKKGTCQIKGDFVNDTWDEIIANLKIDKHAYDDEIGTVANPKTKVLWLDFDKDGEQEESEEFLVRIANRPRVSTDDDYEEYTTFCSNSNNPQTACGLVIEFVDIIGVHQMNKYSNGSSNGDGNKGGWEYSDMRAYLNNGIYLKDQTGEIDYSTSGLLSYIPEPVKSAIIDTRVVSGHGSNDTTNFTTTDKLYLLSRREVRNYTVTYDTAQEYTRQLDYYYKNNVTTSSYAAAKKKYKSNGNAGYWWLRSTRSDDNHNFNYVNTNGGNNSGSSYNTYGVAPAFRLTD